MKILVSILFIVLISGQKCHPNEEENEIEVIKKRVAYTGALKNARSMDVSAITVM